MGTTEDDAENWLTGAAVAAAVGPRTDAYVSAWRKMFARAGGSQEKAETRLSWHWPAFLFGAAWLAYRKLWLHAALLAVTGLALLVWGNPMSPLLMALITVSVALNGRGLLLRHARKLTATAASKGWSEAELARAGGVSIASAIALLTISAAGGMIVLSLLPGELWVAPALASPTKLAGADPCNERQLVGDALGHGELLELTEVQAAYYDEAYQTQYCTARAVTRSGSGPISYRLHNADNGDLIVEVRDGADGFYVEAAQVLGTSPQKLDGLSETEIARRLELKGLAAILRQAAAAQETTPERTAYEAFRYECPYSDRWVTYQGTPAAERLERVQRALHGYEVADPAWLDDDDRKCAAYLREAAAALGGGAPTVSEGPASSGLEATPPSPSE